LLDQFIFSDYSLVVLEQVEKYPEGLLPEVIDLPVSDDAAPQSIDFDVVESICRFIRNVHNLPWVVSAAKERSRFS
jgi:hypothetical protein